MTRRVCHIGEEAINRGLAKRLEALSKERQRTRAGPRLGVLRLHGLEAVLVKLKLLGVLDTKLLAHHDCVLLVV